MRFLPFEKATINIKIDRHLFTCELWFEVFLFQIAVSQQPNRATFFEDARAHKNHLHSRCNAKRAIKAQGTFMTQRLNGLDRDTQLIQLEVFDQNGHIDPILTAEATTQVLADSNTVRVNGVVDTTATLLKRKSAKTV